MTVLIIRALICMVYIKAPGFPKLPKPKPNGTTWARCQADGYSGHRRQAILSDLDLLWASLWIYSGLCLGALIILSMGSIGL